MLDLIALLLLWRAGSGIWSDGFEPRSETFMLFCCGCVFALRVKEYYAPINSSPPPPPPPHSPPLPPLLLSRLHAQAMEKDVTSMGVATDRIRVYRPLTGAKDYSRAKLRESYDRVSVEKARR